MIRVLILAVLAFFIFADPARADPVTATIAFFTAVKAVAIKIAVQIAVTVAVSMLSKALAKKPVPPGIKTEFTQTGGTVSRTIILGMYCTAGSFAAPPMSHGQDGKTPNAYYTQVITLADYPMTALTGVILNGERIPLNGPSGTYGTGLGGKYAGKAWVKFYNGKQTTADPMLVARYAGYIRPWGADRIGVGVPYAIMTYKYDADLFKSEPAVKFEVQGAALYDIRKDSTRGGAGAHRFDDPTTWEATNNNIVMVWNLLRGIELPGGVRYGGEAKFEDLPLANWVAGMNVCDENIATSGVPEPRYRGGYEITLGEDEPADVIEQLLKACSALITEIGGVYKVRVGPPSLPVMFITDDDIIVSKEQDFDPFPPINASINVVHATYPYPAENWVAHDAPVVRNETYITADGGVEVAADLQFPACPYPLQVQRIMLAWLNDDRRWRRHNMTLGHYAFMLEPLDVVAWSSSRNSYDAKLFEIDTTVLSLTNLQIVLAVREVDPADYDWSPADELPDPAVPGEWLLPEAQAVPGWAVLASSVKDDDGDDRRPALLCGWTADAAEDATAIQIQVRLVSTQEIVTDVTITNIAAGSTTISEGILNAVSYEARARYVVSRPTVWSSWLAVTTGDIRFGEKDGVVLFPDGTTPIWTYAVVGDLPNPPADGQDIAFVEDDGKLYRYVDGAWTAAVSGADIIAASLTTAAFAAGLRPNGVGGALPALPDADWPEGSLYVLTTDGKTYTVRAGAWSADIAATDIEGQIVAGQIANGAVEAAKIAVGAVTTAKIADAAIEASKIANGAVGAAKLNVQIGGGNLVGNASFEARAPGGFRPLGHGQYNNAGVAVTWMDRAGRNGGKCFALRADASSGLTFGINGSLTNAEAGTANVWLPNTTYVMSVYARRVNGAGWSGHGLQLAWNTQPSVIDYLVNPLLTGEWQRYVFRITWGATVETIGSFFITVANWVTVAGDEIQFDDLQIEQGDVVTAYSPRPDEILPNAVTSTMLVDGAVDAAKIAAGAVLSDKIATGAIIAGKLGSGAVIADKLGIGAVGSDKIATGAVIADKVAAGAIVADAIGAGAVIADKIGANAVIAAKISAGAIETDKIAAGAVVAAKIAAGAVTADKIVAGAILTDKLAAGAVTASKLLIGDTSQLILNGDFRAGSDNWYFEPTATGGAIYISSGDYASWPSRDAMVMVRTGAGGYNVAWAGPALIYAAPAMPTSHYQDQYLLEGYYYSEVGSGSPYFQILKRMNDGSTHALTVEEVHNGVSNLGDHSRITGSKGGFHYFAVTFRDHVVGDGKIQMRIVDDGATASTNYFWNLTMRRKNAGQMIVDGAILANKIAAGAVTADKITAGAVTAGKIAAGAVVAENIAAGQITASKLALVASGAALNSDPFLTDIAAWETFGGSAAITQIGYADVGVNVLYNTAPSTASVIDKRRIPVNLNKTYRVKGNFINTGSANGTAYLVVALYDDAGVNITGDGSYWYYPIANAVLTTSWLRGSFLFGAGTARPFPSNAASMSIGAILNYEGSAGTHQVHNLAIEEAIDAELVVDGSIIANKIAAGAVTADKITAGAITTGKIAAGAITATEIATAAITTEKLVVSPGNLIDNASFETGDLRGWRLWANADKFAVVNSVSALGAAGPSLNVLRVYVPSGSGTCAIFAAASAYSDANSRQSGFAVTGGEEFAVSIDAMRWTGCTFGSVVIIPYFFKSDGSLVDTTPPLSFGPGSLPGSNSWVNFKGSFIAPANTTRCWLYIYIDSLQQDLYMTNLRCVRRADANLIVDGSILAGKIATGAVTADKITAGAVTAAKINVTDLSAISANLGIVTAGLIRSAASGQRTEIDPNGGRVYDSAGTLRVRWGQW